MTLIESVRAKGHDVRLGRDGVTIEVTLSAGRGDPVKASEWVKANEQQLRRELVSEIHAVANVRTVFSGAKLRTVRSADGKEIRGKVEIRQ